MRRASHGLSRQVLEAPGAEDSANAPLSRLGRDLRWTLRNDPWDKDPNQSVMRLLSAEVTYTAQGRDYSVKLSTLVDSSTP